MPWKILYAAFFSFFLFYAVSGQKTAIKEKSLKLTSQTDSILQKEVDLDRIPGAVVEIKISNSVIYRNAYGYAQKYDYNHKILNNPEKMTADHLFDVASLTKVVGTTTSIMLLADRGQLSIDDPVCKYLKGFDLPDKKKITIRHLLTHTAGLYEWYPLYYLASDRRECYDLISRLPLAYPVGRQRRYSDLGFVLLGEIIEVISGLPLEKFVEQNVFQPLGMKNTMYNPLSSGRDLRIAATSPGNPYEKRMVSDPSLGYTRVEIDLGKWDGWRKYVLKGEVNDGNAWYGNGGISGAAGLFSTVDDLQKLVDMLIKDGMTGSGRFLSAEIIKTFLTKDEFKNGLGWMMDPANSFMKEAPEGTFGHTGFTGTSIVVIPEYKASLILLINRQNTGLTGKGNYYDVNPVRGQVFKALMHFLSAGKS